MAPDGADLTEALCEKLNYKGKVAILVGSVGAPCHEDRARGTADTIAKYKDMICEYFKQGAVFRIGGDEFVVLLQGRI